MDVHISDSIRPLIALPSPRDITIVKQYHEQLSILPHLWVKYWPELYAYTIIQHYFLNHKEYTHLCLAPDDLIIKVEQYNQLVRTLENNIERYPVFSGVCNISMVSGHEWFLNVCVEGIPRIERPRHYNWVNLKADNVPKGVTKVTFAGFPCMFIRRDVLEKVTLNGDLRGKNLLLSARQRKPTAFDTAFCFDCNELGIPMYVDMDIRMLHLKDADNNHESGTQLQDVKTNKEPPLVYLTQEGKEVEDNTLFYRKYIAERNDLWGPESSTSAHWISKVCGY